MPSIRHPLVLAAALPLLLGGVLLCRQDRTPPASSGSPARTRPTGHPSGSRSSAETARRLEGRSAEEVARLLSGLPASERDEVLSILTAEHGRTDPQLALQYARLIVADPLRHETVALAIAFLFERDPRAALALLHAETGPSQRAAIETRLIPALAAVDAPAAIDLLAAGTMEAAHSPLLLAATVQRWTVQDAPAAAAWSTDIEDTQLRTLASTAIAETWATRDATAFESWLGDHPDSRDLAAAYAEWRHPSTPEQREQLANQATSVPDGSISEPCPGE
ncbi:hypothetical protein [Luteolibacter sp. LG18]|uniref:hypothetical protein n=1 Tax=Luteolibacter sp. LG18 TaxID=2819286 RepID=UPI002B31E582|nr:hypothetical protein llg_14490 [Luteolibacter sp. LG18]